MKRARMPAALVLGGLLVVCVGRAPPLAAQESSSAVASPQEARMLREAAALESRGSFQAAEARLRTLLERYPESAAGVFGLERVLRPQERLADVLPAADAYLEARPRGQAVRFLKLRVLAELDSLGGVRDATRDWIEANPGSLAPYQEASRVWEDALGPDEALGLLEEGRRRLDREDALAVVVGDLRARTGDLEGAVAEWSRAIGEEGSNLSGVLGRLRELGAVPAELARSLVDSLAAEPTTTDRLRAAMRVAVDAGLEGRTVELGDRVLPLLAGRERRGFLVDVSRRAEEAELPGVALWAFEALREDTGGATEGRAVDRRLVELFLAVGDTAGAVRAQRRVTTSLEAGSTERRRALARLVRLRGGTAAVDEMVADLRAFREEFPDAPELDLLGSDVARRFLARGEAEAAARALEGIEGPRSSVERGYLALHHGRTGEAIAEFRGAAEDLDPQRATTVVDLITLLSGVSGASAELVARASVRTHRGEPAAAADTLVEAVDRVSLDDRSALLALAARMADEAGEADRAARIRERLVEDFPEATETAEAVVRLARHRASTSEGREEAIRLLEQLIVNRPESAVAPEARRILQRIQEEVPGGGRR